MMSQSKGELNSDKQILYLVQWFAEFSEFQRQDFLQDYLGVVYQKFFQQNLFTNSNSIKNNKLQNGSSPTLEKNSTELEVEKRMKDDPIVNSLESLSEDFINSLNISTTTRPPSIFQCRMKLFKEWFITQWNDQDRIEFLLRLKNVDSEFVWDLYRLLLKQQNLLDREKFSKLIDQSQGEEPIDTKKRLVERLDLFNEMIFSKKSSFESQPMADLTQNGFNHPEAKHTPDLLANCHYENESKSESTKNEVAVKPEVSEIEIHESEDDDLKPLEVSNNHIAEDADTTPMIRESPPDLLV